MDIKKQISILKIIVGFLMVCQIGMIVFTLFNDKSCYDSNKSTQQALEFEDIEEGKYVLYIGTNDKDTYTQLISYEDARRKVETILSKYLDGYTLQDANGGWIDEKGVLTEEQTLVYTIIGADEADIVAIMDEILVELNQNTIMVERQDITYCYYGGR